jgi:hypothetical protein
MKRLYAVLGIVAAATFLFAMQVYAEPRHIPHEDPNKVEDFIDNTSLLLYYADVLNKIGQGDYTNAIDLINQLQYAHIPEEQRQLLDKYSGLINELPNTITLLQDIVNDASSLFSQYRLDEARAKLDEAQSIIEQMETLLADIEADTEKVGENFGVFHALPNSLLFKAWETLQDNIDAMRDIKEEAADMQALLGTDITDIYAGNLKATTLTLALSPTAAYVGDSVSVSGTLSSQGKSLSKKTIKILVDGVNASVGTTNSKGKFNIAVFLPYNYIATMPVMAQYTPAGKDLNKYLPSISPIENITAYFYQTWIELDTPAEGYPGIPLAVHGEVLSAQPDDSESRSVEIYLDDNLIGMTSTAAGIFNMEPTIGINTSLGQHNISAIVFPNDRYAGASYNKTITVTRVLPDIDIKAPTFIILPSKINITGNISSELPMEGGMVSIDFAGKSTEVAIQDDGRFSANLSIGLAWRLSGSRELTVQVNPAEPWNGTAEVKIKIFTLNAVNVAALVFCVATVSVLGTVTYTRRKKRVLVSELKQHITELKTDKTSSIATAAQHRIVLEGNKAKLLEAYVKAVRVIEKEAAVKMELNMTMREFLTAVKPKLHKTGEDFASLTAMAEKALYSPHETLASEAAAAEELMSTIMGAI